MDIQITHFMKKRFLFIATYTLLISLIILSCQKKNDSTAITPTYGTGGNPNPNNQTVTGSTTFTNPATENTSLVVGGSGWSNPTCVSSASLILKGVSGDVSVTLSFLTAPTTGTFAVSANSGQGVCTMMVLNAPNQPAGTVWIGKSGTVIISSNATSINASFTSVVCTQQTFNFPTVSVTGAIGCNQ